jgi:hypothetical protein
MAKGFLFAIFVRFVVNSSLVAALPHGAPLRANSPGFGWPLLASWALIPFILYHLLFIISPT